MMLIFIALAGFVYFKKVKFNNKMIIEFGMLSIMIATFLLPRMHDRYLYVCDVLSIVYLIYNKNKWYIPVGINLVSLYGYANFLCYEVFYPIEIMVFVYFIIITLFSRNIYLDHFSNKKIEKEIADV